MYKRSLSLLAAVLLVSGCSTQIAKPYQPTATVDASVSLINSEFTVMTGSDSEIDYPSGFGVIAGVDNETTYYALIAPTSNDASADDELNTYNLMHSAVLKPDEIQAFIDVITKAVENWTVTYTDTKGAVLWKSVVNDHSDIYFSFYNNAEGVRSSIGFDTHKKQVEIRDASEYVGLDVREKYIMINNDNEVLSVTTHKYNFTIESIEELKGIKHLLEKALQASTKPVVKVDLPVSEENNETALVETVVVEESNSTAAPVVVEETNTTVVAPVIVEEAVEMPAEENAASTENNATEAN